MLVHDLSFVARREQTTRNLAFIGFFVLAVSSAAVTVLAARIAWRRWLKELAQALDGHASRDFQPLVRHVRELVERLRSLPSCSDVLARSVPTTHATASYSSSMDRIVLEPARIHPAAKSKIADNHRAIVEECQRVVASHQVVVIGMSQNPHPRRARKALEARRVPFHYLEYGSYLGAWRERTAIKMWTGWPTFPMIFVGSILIGGANELEALLLRGELDALAKV